MLLGGATSNPEETAYLPVSSTEVASPPAASGRASWSCVLLPAPVKQGCTLYLPFQPQPPSNVLQPGPSLCMYAAHLHDCVPQVRQEPAQLLGATKLQPLSNRIAALSWHVFLVMMTVFRPLLTNSCNRVVIPFLSSATRSLGSLIYLRHHPRRAVRDVTNPVCIPRGGLFVSFDSRNCKAGTVTRKPTCFVLGCATPIDIIRNLQIVPLSSRGTGACMAASEPTVDCSGTDGR